MKKHKRSRELPIDRGWSWVICFASFLCMFVTGTSMQALSVLFLELVNEFESSVTVTSLTVMCFVMSLSVSSVVSTSVLIPVFGERPVVAVSGALFALCSVGYFLAPNIWVFIAFAAGKGTCVGMIFVPCISLLSYYFDKRRSLATTIANSGVCVASIVSPPIIRAITRYYGMRGTFLLLAAIELHMVAAAFLMRPVSSYLPLRKEDTGLTTLPDDESVLIKEETNTQDKKLTETNDDKSEISSKPAAHSENTKPDQIGFNNGKKTPTNGVPNYPHRSSEVSAFLETDEQFEEKTRFSRSDSRKGSTSRQDSTGQQSFRGSNSSLSQRHKVVSHHESMLSITSGLEPGVAGLGLHGLPSARVKEHGWRNCCCIVILKRIFDPYLFNQWSYRVFLLSCLPSATTQYLLQYIPTIAVIKGASRDEAATLLTIVGSVDLISRMAVGVLADAKLLRVTQIVAIAQICQGILCQFNPLFDTFEKMIAMVVFMGLFIGTRQSLIAMTHIEIVGMEKMARCLSITAMLATISAASHSPLLSAIMEATGSYNIVLHYVGISLIVGAILILLIPLLERIDAKREAKKKASSAKGSQRL